MTTSRVSSWTVLLWLLLLLLSGCTAVSATVQSTARQEQPFIAEQERPDGAVSPQPPTSAIVQSTADQEPLLAQELEDGAVSPQPRAFDTQSLGLGAPEVPQFGRKNSIVGESSNYQHLAARNSSLGSEVSEAPADVREGSTVQYLLTAINAPCCPEPTVEEAIEAAKMLPGVLEAEAIEGGIQVTYQPDVVESDAIASTINRVSFMVETVPQELPERRFK